MVFNGRDLEDGRDGRNLEEASVNSCDLPNKEPAPVAVLHHGAILVKGFAGIPLYLRSVEIDELMVSRKRVVHSTARAAAFAQKSQC